MTKAYIPVDGWYAVCPATVVDVGRTCDMGRLAFVTLENTAYVPTLPACKFRLSIFWRFAETLWEGRVPWNIPGNVPREFCCVASC